MKLLIIIPFIAITLSASSQSKLLGGIVVRGKIVNSDTIAIFDLREVVIYSPLEFKNNRAKRRFDRLARNVKRVYPYAKAAGILFNEYNTQLQDIDNERARKRLMKKAEDDLRSQYEDELKRLTISQGKILVRLLDRETTLTTYELLQDFRGNVMAGFWQGLGRVFGYNLKTKWDPSRGEDKEIELIIQMIEAGFL